nr:aminotransferase class IV [Bacteroidota bacterium]
MLQKFNPQNENIFVFVKDNLYPRNEAKVSVFDSSVQGGDAVWEGLRVYNNKIMSLNEHLDRIEASAHALQFNNVPSREFIIDAIKQTLAANKMDNNVHIRLTLTRGEKITSGMDPRLNTNGCCLIVLAEWKPPVYDNETGVSLVTAHIRRNGPQFLDSKIHHNNLLNNILAKIQANLMNADDALMLDNNGFVSETNACNIFMIKNDLVYTPHADSCLPGITRSTVINMCNKNEIVCVERNLSLTEFYNADVVFTSGTMGELTKVNLIDGRNIVNKKSPGKFLQLQELFKEVIRQNAVAI